MSGRPVDDVVDIKLMFPQNKAGRLCLRANAEKHGGPIRCRINATQGTIEMLGHVVVSSDCVAAPPEPEPTYPDQFFGPGHLSLLSETTKQLATAGRFPVSLADGLPSLLQMDRIYDALYQLNDRCGDASDEESRSESNRAQRGVSIGTMNP